MHSLYLERLQEAFSRLYGLQHSEYIRIVTLDESVQVPTSPRIHQIRHDIDFVECSSHQVADVSGFLALNRVIDRKSTRVQDAFAILKSFCFHQKKDSVSKICFLLSKKFRANIDRQFLAERIKNLVLKNGIKDNQMLAILRHSDIKIDSTEYESTENISQMEILLQWFNTIELITPVDLYARKIKETYNRAFWRNLQSYGRARQQELRKQKNKRFCSLLEKRVAVTKQSFFSKFQELTADWRESEWNVERVTDNFKIKVFLEDPAEPISIDHQKIVSISTLTELFHQKMSGYLELIKSKAWALKQSKSDMNRSSMSKKTEVYYFKKGTNGIQNSNVSSKSKLGNAFFCDTLLSHSGGFLKSIIVQPVKHFQLNMKKIVDSPQQLEENLFSTPFELRKSEMISPTNSMLKKGPSFGNLKTFPFLESGFHDSRIKELSSKIQNILGRSTVVQAFNSVQKVAKYNNNAVKSLLDDLVLATFKKRTQALRVLKKFVAQSRFLKKKMNDNFRRNKKGAHILHNLFEKGREKEIRTIFGLIYNSIMRLEVIEVTDLTPMLDPTHLVIEKSGYESLYSQLRFQPQSSIMAPNEIKNSQSTEISRRCIPPIPIRSSNFFSPRDQLLRSRFVMQMNSQRCAKKTNMADAKSSKLSKTMIQDKQEVHSRVKSRDLSEHTMERRAYTILSANSKGVKCRCNQSQNKEVNHHKNQKSDLTGFPELPRQREPSDEFQIKKSNFGYDFELGKKSQLINERRFQDSNFKCRFSDRKASTHSLSRFFVRKTLL